MPADKRKERARKKRQQQARKALESFLARLRRACKTLERIEQWVEHTTLLGSILKEYADVLPPDAQARLRAAMKIAQATREALENACEVLQREVEKVIALLPAAVALSLGTVLIGAFIVTGVAVGGAAAWSVLTSVSLVIENQNCSDIQFPPSPVPVPGLDLPQGVIRAGGHAQVQIPSWVTLNVDASASPPVLQTLAGSFPVPANVTSIKLAHSRNPGGTELLVAGTTTPVNLDGAINPRLIVACR